MGLFSQYYKSGLPSGKKYLFSNQKSGEVTKMKKILEMIKGFVGEKLLALLLAQFLTPENIKKAVTEALEILDDLAKKTETPIDDEVIARVRSTFGIADIPEASVTKPDVPASV
jgi:hypothetical protein